MSDSPDPKSTDEPVQEKKEPVENKQAAQAGSKKTAPKPKNKKPVSSTALAARLITLVLILGLAGLAAFSYFNFQAIQSVQLANRDLKQSSEQLSGKLQQLQRDMSQLQGQDQKLIQQTEQNQTEQNYLKDSLKQLTELVKEKGQDPILWQYAEVDYLLSVANHRVILERDVQTAVTALQDADKRLERIGDPALIPIRKQIAEEITALNSVEIPDISGMAIRLSALSDNIQNLPLNRVKREVATEKLNSDTVTNWNELSQKVMDMLKGVVSVRRSKEVIEPLLPPQEQHYLTQNLGLKLEESRMALLKRDTAVFRRHIKDIRQWVSRYFDGNAAAVTDVIQTVGQLEQTELKPGLPDISGSLRQLRRWVSSQSKRAGIGARG